MNKRKKTKCKIGLRSILAIHSFVEGCDLSIGLLVCAQKIGYKLTI